MPLLFPGVLLFWVTGLLSFGLLGGGGYLIWAWEKRILLDDRYLWTGIALIAVALLGGFPLRLLLGRAPKPGEDEPNHLRAGKPLRIERPDGTELFIETYGPQNAPTLLLTHGWGLSGAEWYYAKKAFANQFHLVLWDLRGLGNSTRPKNNDFELETMARDLEAVLTAAGGDGPVVLGGHSIGGMITLTFCRLFPEHLRSGRVAGLILTHTTYTNPVRTAKGAPILHLLQKPLLEPLTWLMIPLSPLMRLMAWMSYANGLAHLNSHLTHFGGKETRGQLDWSVRFGLSASPAVCARGMFAMTRYDATDVLPNIPVPTLVFAANKDQATVPEANQHIAAVIPGADATTLTPAGHLGLVECHEDWITAVGAFTEKCCRRDGSSGETPARVAAAAVA